jgi:hypothetical protein
MDPGGNLITHQLLVTQGSVPARIYSPPFVITLILLWVFVFILFFIFLQAVHSAGCSISFQRHRVDDLLFGAIKGACVCVDNLF